MMTERFPLRRILGAIDEAKDYAAHKCGLASASRPLQTLQGFGKEMHI
jgi:hypothetical protein